MSEADLQKIRFFDSDIGYENLWAEKNDAGLYVIKSIPYFIYDISIDDVVRAAVDENDHVLCFLETIYHSSHSTIRVRPKDFTLNDPHGESLLEELKKFGVFVETLPPRLIAVDIPDCARLESITSFLTQSSIPWEWADQAPC